MFAGFMVNAWLVATIVAVLAGAVGFICVLRGATFVAHAIPNGSFAGAAGAALVGASTLIGLALFSLLGAAGITWLSRAGRRDVATALTLSFMLALGALFLSFGGQYAPAVYTLLFGEVLGIGANQLLPTLLLSVACIVALAIVGRPMLLASVLPDVGEAQGISAVRMELAFLVLVAATTTVAVPVVGTLLIFSLMVGPPAAARSFTDRPSRAVALSVAIALGTVWAAIAAAYQTDYPIGFFVGGISALAYAAGRAWAAWRPHRPGGRLA